MTPLPDGATTFYRTNLFDPGNTNRRAPSTLRKYALMTIFYIDDTFRRDHGCPRHLVLHSRIPPLSRTKSANNLHETFCACPVPYFVVE